jgi:Chlamydia polymorphic membrane protein (Chlamydia_PMP) repeat
MNPSTRSLRALVLVTVIFSLALATARSAVLTVTNTQDNGAGSLRDTIAAASAGDTIQFDAALNRQTITLTTAEILIDKRLTINGPGADKLTVQRSTANSTPAFRIFKISRDATLSGLTIANGKAPSDGNSPDSGGGLYLAGEAGGLITIANCVITGNSSQSSGGGIFCLGAGFGPSGVSIINSKVSGNSAAYGGAAYVDGIGFYGYAGSVLRITNSTISGNIATSSGGGICNVGGLTVSNSTISANSATVDVAGGGGGIFNLGNLTIANSTLSGNSASLGGGVKNVGYNPLTPGILTIANSTITGNSASEGGGLLLESYSAQSSRSTIVALNSSANGPDAKGELTSEGFNLIGNNSGATILAVRDSDKIGTAAAPIDPLLGPLQNNGGPTFTHGLLLGSPALDKGDSSGSTVDQRGFGRRKDVAALPNGAGGDGADIGALESAFATLANISTRLRVQAADNAMIGGFIITGTGPKTVLVRGIGPSLPLPGALADPFIEVHGPAGELLATNDNWQDAATRQEIIDSGLAPANDLEPALWGVINPGAYTVVVRGKNDATGIGLFEVYDLDQTVESNLGNISTRGSVGTGNDVMIGGTIIAGAVPARVLFRAIGPSLTNFGVSNALGDPMLELHNGNGALIASNSNWRDTQEAEITATGLAPSNDLESAILRDLAPGPYTAIVRGLNDTTGVALIEAYNLN